MKTLYLVRHAKSSWTDPSLDDQDRPLNKRGMRDAPVMGQRLANYQIRADVIWASPARRAVETARYIASALQIPPKKIKLRERLYTSRIDDLLFEITSCPDDVMGLLVVGHNPVITEFANFLIADKRGVDIDRIPTSGVVAIEFPFASWRQIEKKIGRFLFFDYPKKSDTPG
jgi:phosphohistidine phosphatase